MTKSVFRIYLACGSEVGQKSLQTKLECLAHDVALITSKSIELLRCCEERAPDVAIVGGHLDEDIFEIADRLGKMDCCPVLVIIDASDIDRTHELIDDDIMGILVHPVSEQDLRPALHLAKCRFEQSRRMRQTVTQLQKEVAFLEPSKNCGGE